MTAPTHYFIHTELGIHPPELCEDCGRQMHGERCEDCPDQASDELAEMEAMDRYYESKFSDR